jgi:hypothetical protein
VFYGRDHAQQRKAMMPTKTMKYPPQAIPLSLPSKTLCKKRINLFHDGLLSDLQAGISVALARGHFELHRESDPALEVSRLPVVV